MKKTVTIFICIAMLLANVMTAYAKPEWPTLSGVEAEGAICMDANSGAILYGKNIHERYYPASITKILTALIVIENCDLEEEVVFSKRAIFDVEEGSSSAGYDVGDKITVRTALYAMLLKSANEVANALAEHVAGSFEAFCDLMNKRAQELGCKDSHFANASGLNNEQHYTSAYDFALICREAFNNDIFVQFDGTTYYTLPPSIRNPEPTTVYAHHSMLKKSNSLYYEGIIGGKTGYTSLAGNTLVTCAQRENLKLITVVLNGHQTHYSDTKLMLDFGFNNFRAVRIDELPSGYTDVFRKMDITGTGLKNDDVLRIDGESTITLPAEASTDDTTHDIVYTLDERAPEDAVAQIRYRYGNQEIGSTYITRDFVRNETSVNIHENAETPEETAEEDNSFAAMFARIPLFVKIAAAAVIVFVIVVIVFLCRSRRRRRVGFKISTGSGGKRKRR